MKHRLTKIERLDWAARAMVAAGMVPWGGVLLLWYPIVRMWLWRETYHWGFARGVPEAWTWGVVAGVATVPTVMLLLRHRYAILAVAWTDTLIGASWELLIWSNCRRPFDWIYYASFSLLWICFGLLCLRSGIHLPSVYSPGWELEREQVEQWLLVLQRNGKGDNVIEIREFTFVGGSRTYRILNAHFCWVVATFRTGKEDDPPIDYRVREPGAITLLGETGGIPRARVDGDVIPR